MAASANEALLHMAEGEGAADLGQFRGVASGEVQQGVGILRGLLHKVGGLERKTQKDASAEYEVLRKSDESLIILWRSIWAGILPSCQQESRYLRDSQAIGLVYGPLLT